MRKIVTIILTIITMVTGLVAPANATKAEAARVEDSHVIYTVSDLVATAKYYVNRNEYRTVMTVDGGAVCVLYHGRIEAGYRYDYEKMLYADVIEWYISSFLKHYNVEVPEI